MADSYYKSSDQVLVVEHDIRMRSSDWAKHFLYIFDFEFRTMTVVSHYNTTKEHAGTHPFPGLDHGLLARMREKLIELGGDPAPLTDEKKKLPAPLPPRKDGGLAP
jgi:hypothetical protein